jgi:hypothetical protein
MFTSPGETGLEDFVNGVLKRIYFEGGLRRICDLLEFENGHVHRYLAMPGRS